MLRPNKSAIYTCNLATELDRTLVRTGTYADGNCFIHAVLTAIDVQYRREKTAHAHLQRTKTFRQNLSEWLTLEIFRTLGNGEQIRIHFMTAFNSILDSDYAAPVPASDESVYVELLRSVLPRKVVDSEILPKALQNPTDGFYVSFCSVADSHVRKQLESTASAKQLQRFCQWMQTYFVDCFERAHQHSLHEFKARLARSGEFTDSLQMECIARYTGYNFIFIRDTDQQAYPGLEHLVTFDPERQCLVFLWVNDNHFEIIGELEGRDIINRIFNADDDLVEELRSLPKKNAQ